MASFHRVVHKNGTFGDIIQCAHDPCHLHGDGDIRADNLEDAYKQFYDSDACGIQKNNHPRITKQIFRSMKRTAVPFLLVSIGMSLSACGTTQGYDNSSVLNSPASSSRSASPSIDADGDATAKNTLNSYKDRAEEYYNRAKSKIEQYKSQSSASSSSATGVNGVPASLNANSNITKEDLESLTVVADHGRLSTYNRKSWSDGEFAQYGNRSCWSVRDEVIKRQANPGTLKLTPDGCAVRAVSFTDPYSGRTISEDSARDVEQNIQIDHMVPISYMNSNGGSAWSSATKDEYYNDMDGGHLVAVSSSENDAKSDYGPSTFLPDGGRQYQLAYAQDWVAVLKDYVNKGDTATIEQSDYNAIMNVFSENNVR